MASPSPNDNPTFSKEEIKKNLFKSPNVECDRMSESSSALSLMNRLQIDYDIEMSKKLMQKDDMHEQRLKQLRQKLKNLSEDDWMYQSVEKLLGLS